MLELSWIQSTPSLPELPGPLWHGVVAPERVLGEATSLGEGKWVKKMLELSWIQSTPSLPELPGPLWHGVVAPDRVLGEASNLGEGK